MSLIEQAAQRLAQLRPAGVDVPPQSVDEVAKTAVDEPALPSHAVESPLATGVGEQVVLQSPEMAMSRRVELDLQVLSAAGIISPDAPLSLIHI